MLKENIKLIRKSKGLSQEELAIKLNVVRQTISKWEQGLSVPDAEMLISLSEVFETPVSTLLGEKISEFKNRYTYSFGKIGDNKPTIITEKKR